MGISFVTDVLSLESFDGSNPSLPTKWMIRPHQLFCWTASGSESFWGCFFVHSYLKKYITYQKMKGLTLNVSGLI